MVDEDTMADNDPKVVVATRMSSSPVLLIAFGATTMDFFHAVHPDSPILVYDRKR